MMSGLYVAHDDPNVSLPSDQSGVEVPFITNDDNNDRIDYATIITFNGSHGSASYNASTQKMGYSLETDYRTMGEYLVAINELLQVATDYENINVDYVTRVYDTKIAALGRLKAFLSNDNAWLSNGIIGIVSGANEAASIASELFTMLVEWKNDHIGDSFDDIIDGVEQQLITRKSDEIAIIRQAANDLRDVYNAFVASHSPVFVAGDSFVYVAEDSEYTGSGEDYTYDFLFSTAHVTVAINRYDFSSAIEAINSYRDSQEYLKYAPQPFEDVNAAYGEMLKALAEGQGWELTLWQFTGSTPNWNANTTDWPWWDATDIADELNRIGYFNDD